MSKLSSLTHHTDVFNQATKVECWVTSAAYRRRALTIPMQ